MQSALKLNVHLGTNCYSVENNTEKTSESVFFCESVCEHLLKNVENLHTAPFLRTTITILQIVLFVVTFVTIAHIGDGHNVKNSANC